VSTVLKEVKSGVTSDHLMVSIALGVPIWSMEESLPPNTRVIRVMSNTPAIVREGASVYCMGTNAHPEDGALVKKLFSSVGSCEKIPETAIDAVTGLSGSGPAYCFLALEALADGGVRQGLRRDVATKLAAQTMLGAAKMVLETGRHPGALKDDVCSPGGSTIHGLYHLEKSGLRPSLIEAVAAATNICREAAESLVKARDKEQRTKSKNQRKGDSSSDSD
jgi:pyrroline-5-carboxylate reductase